MIDGGRAEQPAWASALGVVTHLSVAFATLFVLKVEWWFLAYLLFIFLPVALLVLADRFWSRKRRPPRRSPLAVVSLCLLLAWLGVSLFKALTVPWLGH